MPGSPEYKKAWRAKDRAEHPEKYLVDYGKSAEYRAAKAAYAREHRRKQAEAMRAKKLALMSPAERAEAARREALTPEQREEERRQYDRAYRERNAAALLAYRAERRVLQAAQRAKTKYGLCEARLAALMKHQKGGCAVCRRPIFYGHRSLAPLEGEAVQASVDHDHATGKIRGLLCPQCNTFEGLVRSRGPALQAYLANPPAAILDFA